MATPSTIPATSSTTPPTRRPYRGSCHCGHTKYIAYLTLPPPIIDAAASATSTVRIRKCNCSTCQKMSFFHTRLMDSPNDFLLLNPLNPTDGGLQDYTCFEEEIHFYFCGKCGVRCFSFAGEGVTCEVEIDGKKQEVWTAKKEGWVEGVESGTGYLSVNAATLEPDQEGLNLKEWTEKGWITYLDAKNDFFGKPRLGEPYDGGVY